MYRYIDTVLDLSEIQEIKQNEEEDKTHQPSLEEEKVNTQHHPDSFSMLTDFMADKFAHVDDKMDMFQKAQAGTRQQISELHRMMTELLFMERSK